MERTVVLGAAKTSFGKFGGAAIREAIDRPGVEDGEIKHHIFGIMVQAEVGQIQAPTALRRGALRCCGRSAVGVEGDDSADVYWDVH